MWFLLFLLLSHVQNAIGCAATGGGTVTTTVAPTTTTSGCSTCTLTNPNINKNPMLNQGNKMFTSDTLGTDGTCATRTLVCNVNQNQGAQVSISLNMDNLGTINGVGSAMVTFTCSGDGTQWLLGADAIMQVECDVAG